MTEIHALEDSTRIQCCLLRLGRVSIVALSLDIIGNMPNDDVALYVRLPAAQAQRLSDAAERTGQSKRRLVEDAVRQHLAGDDGLVVGRASLREDGPEVLTLEEAAALL